MRALTVLTLLAVGLSGCKRAPEPTAAPAPDMAAEASKPSGAILLFSADTRGYLGPCGCSENMRGGIARAAAQLGKVRTEGQPVFFVDSAAAAFAFQRTHPAGLRLDRIQRVDAGNLDVEFGAGLVVKGRKRPARRGVPFAVDLAGLAADPFQFGLQQSRNILRGRVGFHPPASRSRRTKRRKRKKGHGPAWRDGAARGSFASSASLAAADGGTERPIDRRLPSRTVRSSAPVPRCSAAYPPGPDRLSGKPGSPARPSSGRLSPPSSP